MFHNAMVNADVGQGGPDFVQCGIGGFGAWASARRFVTRPAAKVRQLAFEFVEHDIYPANKDAAIPVIAAFRQKGFGGGTVGFFQKLLDFIDLLGSSSWYIPRWMRHA